MATGPQHYREAEEDIAAMGGKTPMGVQTLLARAQVHATLALAAATALNDSKADRRDPDYREWRAAASASGPVPEQAP